MTIKPPGTVIGVHTDINAEPPSYGNNLDKYHDKHWWDGNEFPAPEGNFGTGLLKMSTFYNKRFSSPTPTPATQDLGLPDCYPFGGCAGSGWAGAAVHIVSGGAVTFTCVTRCNDYGCGETNDNITLGAFSNFYNSAGVPQTWEATVLPGGWGRDAISWYLRFVWDTKSGWLLHVMADCKGGGRGWYTVAVIPIANVRPITAYPAAGTLMTSYCHGQYLYGLFSDGGRGGYEQLLKGLTDGVCGYVAPDGSTSYTEPGTCFLPGSKVRMADGTDKNIEDVKIGEYVLGAFGEFNQVIAKDDPWLGNRFMYKINGEHDTSDDHPHVSPDKKFYCPEPDAIYKEWGSYFTCELPDGTFEQWLNVGLKNHKVELLTPGVVLQTLDGGREVKEIIPYNMPYDTKLYNLVVAGSHTYFVNEYAVTGWPREDDFDYDTWKPTGVVLTYDDYRNPKV